MNKTDEDWQKDLTPEQYRVLRQKSTETPFTGEFVNNHESGLYKCAGCGTVLFNSETKFDSGTGWPSFAEPANLENITLTQDDSYGMSRVEVSCKNCGGHLGHVFDDGPASMGGKRFCINSCSLSFDKK